MSYESEYRRSLNDPEGFWEERAHEIDWFRFPETILSTDDRGIDRWYGGGKLNSAWLALDRHVEAGRGEQAALIYDSPVTGALRSYSFAELTDAVARFAGVLKGLGIGKGDRVVIYMPMVPESAIAMLACARLGAIHSVVFGGFASRELAMRIDDATPKLVLSASCGIEFDKVIPYKPLLDGAVDMARHEVERCVILQREQEQAVLVAGRYSLRGAISIGASSRRRQRQRIRWRWMQRILCTSSTRPGPLESRRECCATTVVMPLRSTTACQRFTAWIPQRCSGRTRM